MAKIIYPQSKSYRGPFLLEKEDIEKLDNLLNVISNKLTLSNDNQIREEIFKEHSGFDVNIDKKFELKRKRYPFDQKQRNVFLHLKSKRKLHSSSFEDLLRELVHNDEEPDGIEISYSNGKNSFDLSINSGYYDEKLKYSIKCQDELLYKDLVFEIESWIDTVKPSPIVKIWNQNGGIAYITLFIFFLIFTILNGINDKDARDYYQDELNELAKEQIQRGTNDTTIYNSIDLLLKLASDYVPNDYISKKEVFKESLIYKMRYILISIVVLAIVINIPPKTTIGLGKGVHTLKKRKLWIKIWLFFVPVLIILPIIINLISR